MAPRRSVISSLRLVTADCLETSETSYIVTRRLMPEERVPKLPVASVST